MLDGVMLLWFILTAAAILFVAIDIRQTPESPVLKWGFVLVTVYTGPIGAFLYVLGCREPLPGLHEIYVRARWRQVLGSTMHCVAGDGIGILAGAVIASFVVAPRLVDVTIEYVLGFGFGWTVFQALFMRDTAGGSYWRALISTVIPEFLSMNYLMAGMVLVVAFGKMAIAEPLNPLAANFWFVMSMALLFGFVAAYPINWWLVARGLKHGMMTVRPREIVAVADAGEIGPSHLATERPAHEQTSTGHQHAGRPDISSMQIAMMAILSIAILGLGVYLATMLDKY